jgi:hypothetical protein
MTKKQLEIGQSILRKIEDRQKLLELLEHKSARIVISSNGVYAGFYGKGELALHPDVQEECPDLMRDATRVDIEDLEANFDAL